jgi:hypothetical protein
MCECSFSSLFQHKLSFDKVSSCCHFLSFLSRNFLLLWLFTWSTQSEEVTKKEGRERERKKLEYLMCFINIYMIVIFKSRQKQNMTLMKNSCFYANIIIYLTIWLLSVPFCHFEVKISIIRLRCCCCCTCTQHIFLTATRKKKETADSSHTCYFINTHIFLLIHGNKCSTLNYMERNAFNIYFVAGLMIIHIKFYWVLFSSIWR